MVWARMVSPSNCTSTSAADNHCCNINIPRNNNAGKLRVNYYIASFFSFTPSCFFFFESVNGSFEGNGRIIKKKKHLAGWQTTQRGKKNKEITSFKKLINFLFKVPPGLGFDLCQHEFWHNSSLHA